MKEHPPIHDEFPLNSVQSIEKDGKQIWTVAPEFAALLMEYEVVNEVEIQQNGSERVVATRREALCPDAWQAFYRRTNAPLFSSIARWVATTKDLPVETGEDVAQDVLLKFYEKALTTDVDPNPIRWHNIKPLVFTMIVNRTIDILRRANTEDEKINSEIYKAQNAIDIPIANASEYDPQQTLEAHALNQEIQTVLNKLQPLDRYILVAGINNIPEDQQVKVLGLSKGAIKSRRFRAKESFRKISQELGIIFEI